MKWAKQVNDGIPSHPLHYEFSSLENCDSGFALISWVFIRTYCGFIGYSEISNFNPQTEYFHKKVNSQLFKKCSFWGCDVENWVWTKLALWICPILWIRVKIGYTQLSLTFFHYYRPIQPIYHTCKKNHFFKKNDFFRCVINRPDRLILMKKC